MGTDYMKKAFNIYAGSSLISAFVALFVNIYLFRPPSIILIIDNNNICLVVVSGNLN